MKKENLTISFEGEQLAALEFSLKKKNTSVQAQLEELLKCAGIPRQPRGARCPSPPSGKTGKAAAAGGAFHRVGAAH